MLIYFVSVASIIAAGVATYFALKLKEERNTLMIKFEQSSKYADDTAKTNLSLSRDLSNATTKLAHSEKRVAELTALADSVTANVVKPVAEVKQTPSSPTIDAKKAGRGRPAKKAVA